MEEVAEESASERGSMRKTQSAIASFEDGGWEPVAMKCGPPLKAGKARKRILP